MDENRSVWTIPVAIIICLLIIAGAFYYQSQNPGQPADNNFGSTLTPSRALDSILTLNDGQGGVFNVNQFDLNKLRPVDATDHLLGNVNAPVKIIVYTDLECPACKYFHSQLKLLESKYVASGKLAIIYRAFPLDRIHPKVRTEFLAAECVNEIGGNDKFWQFIDKIFEITPSNNGLELTKLGETAQALNIDTKSFDTCLTEKKYADKIQRSLDEAIALRAPGTPTFFFIDPIGGISPRGFTYSADNLSAAIDLLLTLKSTTASTTAN